MILLCQGELDSVSLKRGKYFQWNFLIALSVKCSAFFPTRRRDAWATKGAQRFSCANVEVKRQTGHWFTGKCPVSCLLCSGNCSMTAHTSLPRPPLIPVLQSTCVFCHISGCLSFSSCPLP